MPESQNLFDAIWKLSQLERITVAEKRQIDEVCETPPEDWSFADVGLVIRLFNHYLEPPEPR